MLVEIIDLLAHIADLVDCRVHPIDLLVDLGDEVELFLQICLSDLQPRISLELERSCKALAMHRQLHCVRAWNCDWTLWLPCP